MIFQVKGHFSTKTIASMWSRKLIPLLDRLHEDNNDHASQDEDAEKQDDENYSQAAGNSRLLQLRELVLHIAALSCLWIVLVTAWRTTIYPTSRTIKYEKTTLKWGNTTAAAEARGCSFDLLSHNWLPQPCLDPLSEAEYREYVSSPDRKLGPYPYFLDREGTRRISSEREFALLANGPLLADQHVFTTREEHFAHSNFLLRRTHLVAEGKVRVNDEILQFWHTEHCLEMIRYAERKPMDELNEGFYVGCASCTTEVPV